MDPYVVSPQSLCEMITTCDLEKSDPLSDNLMRNRRTCQLFHGPVTPSKDQLTRLSHCDADPGRNRELRALSPYGAAFSEMLANGQTLTVSRRSLSRDTGNARSNQARATPSDREEASGKPRSGFWFGASQLAPIHRTPAAGASNLSLAGVADPA